MPEASAPKRNRISLEVDRTLCFGFGDCVDTAPAVFALDDQNTAIVLDSDGDDPEIIVEAAQNCPVDAIIVRDDEGNQIYP